MKPDAVNMKSRQFKMKLNEKQYTNGVYTLAGQVIGNWKHLKSNIENNIKLKR